MLRTQRKRSRSSCGTVLVVIRTTTILVGVLMLLASVKATHRSSGPDRSSCDKEFHHPDPKSCSSFLVLRMDCSSKPQVTVQRRQCPLGLLFHKPSKTCEFPWNTKCRLPLSVPPSTPTRSLYSTISRKLIHPTPGGITREINTVGSESSTGAFVGATTELFETTTDFKARQTTTDIDDQSNATVSRLFSVPDEATAIREELTTASNDATLIATSTTETHNQITMSTDNIDLKTHPTSEATIRVNDSAGTTAVTAGTSAADSTLGIADKMASEHSVWPATAQSETTYDTIEQTRFNLEGKSTQTTASTPENMSIPTTMLKENISRPVTISTMLAEISKSVETRSNEKTSQRMNMNIYSTAAIPEYNSQAEMTENVTRQTSVRIGTFETRAASSRESTAESETSTESETTIESETTTESEPTAESETTTGFDGYFHSSATAEVVTTKTMTEVNVNVTVDENDSFTGVSNSDEILTTKLTEDNTTLVTRLLEVNETQAMTTSEGTNTLQIGTEITHRPDPVAGTT